MIKLVILWEKLCRMVWWGWKMRNNHDWDFAYLYQMMHLKLDRMDKAMLSGKGRTSWSHNEKCRSYRALKEAKEIARRLSKGGEEHKFTMQFHDEYGFRGSLGKLFDQVKVTNISEKEYSRLYKIALKKDQEYYKDLKNRYYYLLNKFGEHWWD